MTNFQIHDLLKIAHGAFYMHACHIEQSETDAKRKELHFCSIINERKNLRDGTSKTELLASVQELRRDAALITAGSKTDVPASRPAELVHRKPEFQLHGHTASFCSARTLAT